MNARIRQGLGVLAGAALLSCAGTVDPPGSLVSCSPPLALAVGKSLPLSFAWSSRCGATYLEVTSPDRQSVYWIGQADTGRFLSPVLFGITPDGMRSSLGPVSLPHGREYLLRLGISGGGNSLVILGEQAFSN